MSLRQDLLVLTAADLADISNRGTVKRATKELDQQKVTYDLVDVEGTLTVTWSDGPVSVLPAGRTVADGDCDCPATGMCRHLIRAVLAYQALHEGESADGPVAPIEPWNPGDISDETLAELFSSRMLASLRTTFEEGLVVEVLRSTKPVARFHKLRHTIRFLVPGDARYSQCDCAEKAPCRHAALAVWAFRELGGRDAAIVDTQAGEYVDANLIAETEEAVRLLVETGVANTPTTTMDRLRAVEKRLRNASLVWPAEILLDLRRQYDHYHSHDARFSPDMLCDLVGELMIRFDALRNPDLPVPALFVRGHKDDQDARLGQSRLIGLGCGVRNRQNSVEILALMQDDSSGTVVAVSRHFPDPTDEEVEPEDLSRLGSKLVVKGRDLTTIGAGQLVIKTGKLYSDHRLSLGRSTASVYAQNYAWEELRPPVHAEAFAEVRARLAQLPPASLRPRRLGEDLQVVRVHGIDNVRFSAREQAVRARVRDEHGATAELFHPYTTRNRHGTERLLNWLNRSGDRLLYIAGPCRLGAAGLIISPTGLVFDGPVSRTLIQPWVDDMDAHLESSDVSIEPPSEAERPIDGLRRGLAAHVGDTVLTGVDTAIAAPRSEWERFESLAEAMHLYSISRSLDGLRQSMTDDDHHAMSGAVLELCVLSRLAQELG